VTTQITYQDLLNTIAVRESPVTTTNETPAAGAAMLATTVYEIGATFVTEIPSTSILEIL